MSLVLVVTPMLTTPHAQANPFIPDPEFCPFERDKPPTPDQPGSGIPGFFDPDPPPQPPAGDPFAEGSQDTLYEVYGYAGLNWHTYHTECVPDYGAIVDTTIGNWLMGMATTFVAISGALNQAVTPPKFLSSLDPTVAQVTRALVEGGFLPWAGASIGLLGVWVLFKGARTDLSGALTTGGWALGVLALVGALFTWPTTAGQAADDLLSDSIGRINAGFTGQADVAAAGRKHTALIVEVALYRQWLRGVLGSADSAAAKKYGPRLYRATTLTWEEHRRLQPGSEQRDQLIEDKQDQFKQLAEDLEDADPEAHKHLTGQAGGRAGNGLLALLIAMIAALFELIASIYIIIALIVVRGAVMFTPLFAVVGLWLPGSAILRGTASAVGNALAAAIVFATANGVSLLLARHTLAGDGMPIWLGLLVHIIGFFVLYFGARRILGKQASRMTWLIGGIMLSRTLRRRGSQRRSGSGRNQDDQQGEQQGERPRWRAEPVPQGRQPRPRIPQLDPSSGDEPPEGGQAPRPHAPPPPKPLPSGGARPEPEASTDGSTGSAGSAGSAPPPSPPPSSPSSPAAPPPENPPQPGSATGIEFEPYRPTPPGGRGSTTGPPPRPRPASGGGHEPVAPQPPAVMRGRRVGDTGDTFEVYLGPHRGQDGPR